MLTIPVAPAFVTSIASHHVGALPHRQRLFPRAFLSVSPMFRKASSHPLCMFPRKWCRSLYHVHPPRWSANFAGGFLGVGAPEVLVIIAVGWLILGPQKLFELAKDFGKVAGQVRRMSSQAQNTLKEAMEMESVAREEEDGGETDNMKGTIENVDIQEDTGRKVETSSDLRDDEVEEIIGNTTNTVTDGNANGDDGLKIGEDVASRRIFLDQLTRVQDPHQVALKNDENGTGHTPDLDVSGQMELEELDRQYREARQRLLEKHEKAEPQKAEPQTAEAENVRYLDSLSSSAANPNSNSNPNPNSNSNSSSSGA